MRGFNRTAGGIALAISLALSASPAMAQKKKKEPETKSALSNEFKAVAGPLQTAMQRATAIRAAAEGGDAAAKAEYDAILASAPAQLASAEALANNPDEKLFVGQFAVNLGGFNGDIAMRQRGAKNIIDSGKITGSQLAQYQFYLGSFAYARDDFATAAQALTTAVQAGYEENNAAELMLDSYAKAGQPKQGLDLLQGLVDARIAAGKPVPANWFKRANVVAYQAELGPEATRWATLQVQHDPSPMTWLGAAQLVRKFNNFDTQESVDLFRLMMRSGALDADKQFTANEFKEYIEMADPRRLPGEVSSVIAKGVAKGAISESDTYVREASSTAQSRIGADKASLGGSAAQARNSANGTSALSTADGYLNYGQNAEAEALYKVAIEKGGIDANRAWMRLGIAQFDQGKMSDARASFAKVGGNRKLIADLFLALVASKTPATA